MTHLQLEPRSKIALYGDTIIYTTGNALKDDTGEEVEEPIVTKVRVAPLKLAYQIEASGVHIPQANDVEKDICGKE